MISRTRFLWLMRNCEFMVHRNFLLFNATLCNSDTSRLKSRTKKWPCEKRPKRCKLVGSNLKTWSRKETRKLSKTAYKWSPLIKTSKSKKISIKSYLLRSGILKSWNRQKLRRRKSEMLSARKWQRKKHWRRSRTRRRKTSKKRCYRSSKLWLGSMLSVSEQPLRSKISLTKRKNLILAPMRWIVRLSKMSSKSQW